jgi:hypothetical protein
MSDQEPFSRETPAPPADHPRADPRMEDYLDQVCAPLVGWVPYDARMELRVELRAHLESLVAAYRELGSSHDAAVRSALAQSGDSDAVARDWIREWERVLPPRKAPSAWRSILVALGCFGYATSVALALLLAAQSSEPGGFGWHVLLCAMLGIALPCLAGLTTGLFSPARPERAVLAALLVLIPTTTLALPWLLRYTPITTALTVGWIQSMSWIPIGCAAAKIGSWLRTRRDEVHPSRLLRA